MKNKTLLSRTHVNQQVDYQGSSLAHPCEYAKSKMLEEILNKQNLISEKIDELKTGELAFNWVDIPGACKLLKVSPRTLQTYRDESLIGFSQIGSKIYFKLSDLEDFMVRHYLPAIK